MTDFTKNEQIYARWKTKLGKRISETVTYQSQSLDGAIIVQRSSGRLKRVRLSQVFKSLDDLSKRIVNG